MIKRIRNQPNRMPGVKAAMLLMGFAWFLAVEAATFPLENKGWVFLHPFFKDKNWGVARERLLDSLPASLLALKPSGVGFSHGKENVMALFSVPGGDLYGASARYEKVVDPSFDSYLEFGDPKKITLGGLALPSTGGFYIVKDSLYSFDSLRVAVPVPGLKLYIATIRTSSNTVVKLDSVTFSQKQTGQSITDVFGDPDPSTLQDRGVWVTGAHGLVRYVSYTNKTWGPESVRDLPDVTAPALFASSAFASNSSGKIFRWQSNAFVQAAATSPVKAVWRVYPKGAIGDGGLFKELSNTAWKKDTTFGSASYRYANFVFRPGGFGVEVLDSAWTYRAFTYRDTASRIVRTNPASLLDSVNKSIYYFKDQIPLSAWIQLEDLDSNYRDYSLTLKTNGGTFDGKSDDKYSIAPVPDSENCHIGTLKMTSGYVRLTLSSKTIVVEHDCVLGALNSISLSCYWKPYTFRCARNWDTGNSITLTTATQHLKIVNHSASATAAGNSGATPFRARLIGKGFALQLPAGPGTRPVSVAVHDLEGRLLASVPLRHGQSTLHLPAAPRTGLIIVSCAMSDGSVVRRKVPIVR